MKKLIIILLGLLPILTIAQNGKVFDNLSVDSEILKMERKYAIYLPPGYETSERSYPVLYLLHGGGDDHTGWVQFGEVAHIADKSINNGTATPMIIVMPDASSVRRGYFNVPEANWYYEDFFFEEFIPFIEKTYKIRAEKAYRAIAGLSMGGGGTYVYAIHHPELFSSACSLSGNPGPVSIDDMGPFAASRRISPKEKAKELTKEEKQKWFEERSVCYMMENMPEEQKKAVRWYIDCGDDDALFSEESSMIHVVMLKNGIPHEFRVRDGEHNWKYWRSALPEVLKYVTAEFHRP